MRPAGIERLGGDVRLMALPEPRALASDEVLIEVSAAGVANWGEFVRVGGWDVIGGDIQKRSASLIRAGGTLVTVVGPPASRPADGLAIDFVVESDVPN